MGDAQPHPRKVEATSVRDLVAGLGRRAGGRLWLDAPAAARGVLQRGRDAGAGGGVRVFNRKRELFAIPFPTRVTRRMGRAAGETHQCRWARAMGFAALYPSYESRTPGYRSSRVHTAPSSTFTGNFATGA